MQGLAILIWVLIPAAVLAVVVWARADRVKAHLPPPPQGAQWVADPTGRHELRLWDGARWTGHVSTRGVSGWDPLQ